MRRHLLLAVSILLAAAAQAQLKPRPDAFPPQPASPSAKSVAMASSPDQMASWNRYPTYPVYLAMMQHWADAFPSLCRLDTIGRSLNGRLILCLELSAAPSDSALPEFFYSSSIHGDELTGFVLMLRLIDTLLSGYSSNPRYTQLLNTTRVCINPLANPDGTYMGGDYTVEQAIRYNAGFIDLNRNFPDPFSPVAKEPLQPENECMIAYVARHRFRLSANIHGGSEVLNYPWDSFPSSIRPHPLSNWWQAVCKRFVDTARFFSRSRFYDVAPSGFIAGGDWYVIGGGRQDYMNYYHDCLELTMELSVDKTPDADQLPFFWRCYQQSLINFIAEIHNLPPPASSVASAAIPAPSPFPNPTSGILRLPTPSASPLFLYNSNGLLVRSLPSGTASIDLSPLPAGIYLLRSANASTRIVKH